MQTENNETKGKAVRIEIETVDGRVFRTTVPSDMHVSSLAAQFVRHQIHGKEQPQRSERVVVERLSGEQPGVSWHRLNGNETVAEAGIANEDRLRIYSEATAGCFLGTTLVTLANGRKITIAEIAVGDEIRTVDPYTMAFSATRVIKKFAGTTSRYLIINDKLRVTNSHPLWTAEAWVRAGDLQVGNKIVDETGSAIKIESIVEALETSSIFNLHVSSSEHTFIADSFIVHNMDSALKVGLDASPVFIVNSDLGGLPGQQTSSTRFRLAIPLPAEIGIDDFFLPCYQTVSAAEQLYSVFVLLLHSNSAPMLLRKFLDEYKMSDEGLAGSSLRRVLAIAGATPLSIVSVHYGSDASFDLLGIGKVLQIIKELVEDLVWKSAHKRSMASMKQTEKKLDIQVKEQEMERERIEIIGRKIEILKEISGLSLSGEDRALLSSLLLPATKSLAETPIGIWEVGRTLGDMEREEKDSPSRADLKFEKSN